MALEAPTPIETLIEDLRSIHWYDHLWSAGMLALALGAGALTALLLFKAFARWAKRTSTTVDDAALRRLRRPLRWLLPLVALKLALPLLLVPPGLLAALRWVTSILVIAFVAWLAFRAVRMLEDVVDHHFDVSTADNLRARAVHTQMRGFRNIANFLIALVAVAFVLMTFESVRRFGVTLLASAGVAGVIIGFAAQRSISTIIAGIQIAITQPIRVDDVVIVENEWGWIEEIRLTYVVVRIWDLRRLVIPISYFIQHPFQNWTRTSADILGTVFLYTDYTVPVDEVRSELKRILDDSPEWDRKAWGLQVTGTSERTVELRALMSAPDSGTAWNLRCKVREKLIAYVQSKHPQALPRFRADVDKEPEPGRSAKERSSYAAG